MGLPSGWKNKANANANKEKRTIYIIIDFHN